MRKILSTSKEKHPMKKKIKKLVPRKKDEKEILVGVIAFIAGVCYLLWKVIKK